MKESNKSLIDYVKTNYPIGTKFISPQSNLAFEVITHQIAICGSGDIQLRNQGSSCPFVYFNGKWAEIISLPEPKNEIIDNYEIY
jgi:hypothetical protein